VGGILSYAALDLSALAEERVDLGDDTFLCRTAEIDLSVHARHEGGPQFSPAFFIAGFRPDLSLVGLHQLIQAQRVLEEHLLYELNSLLAAEKISHLSQRCLIIRNVPAEKCFNESSCSFCRAIEAFEHIVCYQYFFRQHSIAFMERLIIGLCDDKFPLKLFAEEPGCKVRDGCR